MGSSFRQVTLPEQGLRAGLYTFDVREVPQEAPVAVIGAESGALEELLSIVFQDSHDNLDYVRVAVLELESGRRASLIRHVRSPEPGVEIHTWWEDIDRSEVLGEILASLGIDQRDLSWVRPSLV